MRRSLDPSAAVPTEDTIAALVEHFVAPLLPIRDFYTEKPSDQKQEMVAKQMHAVVMLYNYYHRKRFPKLEVLGLKSVCKISGNAQPGLLAYMKYMHECEENPENLDNELSITEKMVMDACNICIGLDSSKGTPKVEAWPISKIAVFLVDPTKEKCMLQFSSITQGVWSLVENSVEVSSEKVGKGPQTNALSLQKVTSSGTSQCESYQSEEILEQLAFSAVEQVTGIRLSDGSILERHLTYSLSHEKTSTRLYIMQYGRAMSEELTEIAIKDVISSLEGPIVKRGLTSEVEVTSVVEYYNMLPYIEIISNWLSRESTSCDSLHVPGKQVVSEKECTLEPEASPSMEDHEDKKTSVFNDYKVEIQNCRPSKSESEVIRKNKIDLLSVNGSLGGSNRPEIIASSRKSEIHNCKPSKSETEVIDLSPVHGSSRAASRQKTRAGSQKVEIQNRKPCKSQTEVTRKNKKDVSLVNGSSGAANRPENRAGSPCTEPDGLTIMKDLTMNDNLPNGQIEDILNNEKDKLKTNMYNVKHDGTMRTSSSCKVLDPKHPSVPNRITAMEDHPVNKRPSSNEQLSIKCSKMAKTEKQTVDLTTNNFPSTNGISCGVSRSLNIADVLHIEPYGLIKMKNQAKNDKSVHIEQTEDIIISKNNIKHAFTGSKEVGDSCMSGLYSALNSCKGDTASLNHQELLSQAEDISGKNIISDTCIDKKKNSIGSGLIVSVDVSDNMAGMVDSAKKVCVSKCTVKSRTCTNDAIPDGFASDDLQLVPIQCTSNDHSSFYHVIASRENDLMQASLRVLQKKMFELCQQQRLLEDEIARCEMNIQTILSEEGNSTLKAELIIEALNSFCSRDVQTGENLSSQEQGPSQTTKRRTLSEATLSSRTSCQELDNICQRNCWTSPRYCVLPSFADCQITGMFEATVTVEGMDFGCISGGDPKSSPRQARESAAAHMLKKLRRIVG